MLYRKTQRRLLVFRTVQDAESLLNALKSKERNMILGQYREPHIMAGLIVDSTLDRGVLSAKELDLGTYTSGNLNWDKYYITINAADLILDNLHRFPLDKEILKLYELQAYFSKGLSYFHLAQRWGDCPITKGSLYLEKLAKSPEAEVLEEATKWELKAMELPEFENLKDADGKQRKTKQYASKGAAAALLAHIYAWRAAVESKPEYWGEAEKYCTMLINGEVGHYGWARDPEEVCSNVLKRDHSETIWEIYRTSTERLETVAYYQEGFINFPIKLDASTGPLDQPTLAINKTTINEMYDREDRRRDAYFLWLDADTIYMYSQGGVLKADTTRPAGGTYDTEPGSIKLMAYSNETIPFGFVNKFRNAYFELNPYYNELQYIGQDMNKVVWRMADIVLLRAECRVRQNKTDAVEDLNRVRERAYGNREHDYVSSEGRLQDIILREREKELLFESYRFYDLRRNGMEYVRTISEQFNNLTERDIIEGCLFYGIHTAAFTNNDLMRQNVYWNRFLQ